MEQQQQELSTTSDRLRQHFAIRVINEARYLVEFWHNRQLHGWTAEHCDLMQQAAQRLHKQALRYDQPVHANMAAELLELLAEVSADQGRLNSASIQGLHELLMQLAEVRLQIADGTVHRVRERKPLYLALQDSQRAQRLAAQLEYYDVSVRLVAEPSDFEALLNERYPQALIADVDFAGHEQGLQLAERMQSGLDNPVPVIFISEQRTDLLLRLAAVRNGGEAFLLGKPDASAILEAVDSLGRNGLSAPYRVLLVDDSKAQAMLTERTLNAAVFLTRVVNNPTRALQELEDFNPDLIMLDMYMPECSGPELARMIRQCERFDSTPIIYLSGEDDVDKQLQAMRQGADDFLTKPVQPARLIATIRNRVQRARSLEARMVRDGLTGLYNHTHIQHLLEETMRQCQRQSRPLSVVMIDIDHFKRVNDSYGHPVGDRVIKSLALLLRQRLRKTDLCGRYGGEEFLLVLPGAELEQAGRVANELRERLQQMVFQTAKHSFSCSLSGGAACLLPGSEETGPQLINRADEALYRAKQQGRNQVVLDY